MKIRGKVLLLSAAGLLALGLAGFELYRLIGNKEWEAQKAAVEKAYAESILYSASSVVPFSGESNYNIVFGKDKLQKDMLVWVGDKGVHAEYAADGITMEEAADKVKARDPLNQVIRTKPGKKDEDYVWEVFYKKSEDGKERFFYDYFRFSDGKYLDTYNLSLE